MRFILVLFLLISPPSWTQTKTTGQASTNAPCSVANTGSDNKISIVCGIGKDQGRKMLAVLNKILANQLDTEKVMEKLDEIVNASHPTISAPNGIAIGGGSISNPTVNNFGPSPANFTFTEEVITPLPVDGNGLKVMKVHVRTDRSVPGAVVGILFSGPIEKIVSGADEPTLTKSGASQMNWGTGSLFRGGVSFPNSVAVSINIPAAFLPGQELIVTVKSKTDVHVIGGGPVNLGPP